MDNDAAPRRRIVPLWVWFVVGAVVLYLALWGATLVAAQKHVRDLRAELASQSLVWLKTFEATATRPALAPDDPQWYVFTGNIRCPCPLLTRRDEVAYRVTGGIAVQISEIWLGNRWKEIGHQVYWSY